MCKADPTGGTLAANDTQNPDPDRLNHTLPKLELWQAVAMAPYHVVVMVSAEEPERGKSTLNAYTHML
jgi:hypothetical protein